MAHDLLKLRSGAMRLLLSKNVRLLFAVFAVAGVASCDDPGAVAPDDIETALGIAPHHIEALLTRDGISNVREVRRVFTLDSISLYTVSYGDPQDCPSGCFYLSGTILSVGSKVGWIELMSARLAFDPDRGIYVPDMTEHTFFDISETDASFLDEALFDRLSAEDTQHYNSLRTYLGLHAGTPESALVLLANRITLEGWPWLAWAIVTHPNSQCSQQALSIIATGDDAHYADSRMHARELLASYPARCNQAEG